MAISENNTSKNIDPDKVIENVEKWGPFAVGGAISLYVVYLIGRGVLRKLSEKPQSTSSARIGQVKGG